MCVVGAGRPAKAEEAKAERGKAARVLRRLLILVGEDPLDLMQISERVGANTRSSIAF